MLLQWPAYVCESYTVPRGCTVDEVARSAMQGHYFAETFLCWPVLQPDHAQDMRATLTVEYIMSTS